jgi:hypothetical protein
MWKTIKNKWRRPKHRGVSGNYTTIVIVSSIIVGSFFLTGGDYPQLYLPQPTPPAQGTMYRNQPKYEKTSSMTIRQLKFRPLPTPTEVPYVTATPQPTAKP